MFLGNDPNRVYLQVGEGGMRKGSAVWPRVTSFSMFLSMIDGLVFAQGRLEYSFGGPRTRTANLKALGKPCKKVINFCGIWMALKEGCKIVDVNGGQEGSVGRGT